MNRHILEWLAILAIGAIIACILAGMGGCGTSGAAQAAKRQEAAARVEAYRVTRSQGIATVKEIAGQIRQWAAELRSFGAVIAVRAAEQTPEAVKARAESGRWFEAVGAKLEEAAGSIETLTGLMLSAEPAPYPTSPEPEKVEALAQKIKEDGPSAVDAAAFLALPVIEKKESKVMAVLRFVPLGLLLVATVAAYLYLRLTKGKGIALLAGGVGFASCITYALFAYSTQMIILGIVLVCLAVLVGAYYLVQAGKVQVGIVKATQLRRDMEAYAGHLSECDAAARDAMPKDAQGAVREIKAAQGIKSVSRD